MDFNKILGVVGLGYVGLPLAIEFGKLRKVIGFDLNPARVSSLRLGFDTNEESTQEEIQNARHLTFTSDINDLVDCSVFIVTVQTPVDKNKQPDFLPLISACEMIGRIMKVNSIVVFESTVYPGATEEICVPILEKISGYKFNKDFYCGYSPERINPGDRVRTLSLIKKVTSGSTEKIAEEVDNLYKSIISAGTKKVSSMMVAEASKIIENIQRDVNIALVNELSLIFHKIGIDTKEVVDAASTKWNYVPFYPGLVGGHCIGVDPYYLAYKAGQVGYYPELILAGRRINDEVVIFITQEIVRLLSSKKIHVYGAKLLILGVTFKENCSDTRNTKIVDLINALIAYSVQIDIYDPYIKNNEDEFLPSSCNLLLSPPSAGEYDGIIVAVNHNQFLEFGIHGIRSFAKKNHILYDIKGMFGKEETDGRL